MLYIVFSQILKSCTSSPSKSHKSDKDFAKKLGFKDITFPVKIRKIHKIEKEDFICISVFSYENKEKQRICILKTYCQEFIICRRRWK